MGQSVDVVVSELHTAAARLADAGQRMQDGLSSVDAETTQLLGSGWKGQAASAYGPAWAQWHNGAEQVVKSLQRMSELLTIAGKEYAKTDEQAAGALGSSMQGSGGSGGGGTGGSTGAPDARQAGGASNDLAQQMNLSPPSSSASELGQVVEPIAQAGQAVASLPAQAGQVLAGLAQQAAQMAVGLAEQAEREKPGGPDKPAAEDDQRDDAVDGHKGKPEPDTGAAPSGDDAAGTAPVSRGEATRAVARPSEQ